MKKKRKVKKIEKEKEEKERKKQVPHRIGSASSMNIKLVILIVHIL